MNLFEAKCQCKRKSYIVKKRKQTKRKLVIKPLLYPHPDEERSYSKTFHIKYEQKLSSISKLLLKSFRNKYIYYAIDDILYSLKYNSVEQKNLLTVLYSPLFSLQNNFSINFFDIWIREIYISDVLKVNKFLTNTSQKYEPFSYITITFLYRLPISIKPKDSLW